MDPSAALRTTNERTYFAGGLGGGWRGLCVDGQEGSQPQVAVFLVLALQEQRATVGHDLEAVQVGARASAGTPG